MCYDFHMSINDFETVFLNKFWTLNKPCLVKYYTFFFIKIKHDLFNMFKIRPFFAIFQYHYFLWLYHFYR